jgi:hypothetical protein
MVQNSSSAVMQQRHEAPDALDDFPTPPWATRAAIQIIKREWVGGWDLRSATAREPCANRGYMARPLEQAFRKVYASDVHDYGSGYPLLDYLFPGPMQIADWTFMNPPFNLAADFILKSFETPHWAGTAAFVRTSFLEGAGRHRRLFSVRPPTIVAQFVERVILHKGVLRNPDEAYWDGAQWKKPSTATSYCWLIWIAGRPPQPFQWIAPCRKQLERPGDYNSENVSSETGGPA